MKNKERFKVKDEDSPRKTLVCRMEIENGLDSFLMKEFIKKGTHKEVDKLVEAVKLKIQKCDTFLAEKSASESTMLDLI